nr:RNA methyltransferase [Geotalea toluenoxydans]
MEEYSPTAPNVSIALLHYPVYNKNRDVVATAVTNLDLHDIARSARTFGLYRYFVITPVAEQRSLSERIRAHWLEGYGAAYNPKRKAALELIEVIDSLQTALAQLEKKFGKPVKVIVTGARDVTTALIVPGLANSCRTGISPICCCLVPAGA